MKIVQKIKQGKQITGYKLDNGKIFNKEAIKELCDKDKIENAKIQMYKGKIIVRLADDVPEIKIGGELDKETNKKIDNMVNELTGKPQEKKEVNKVEKSKSPSEYVLVGRDEKGNYTIYDRTTKGYCKCTLATI